MRIHVKFSVVLSALFYVFTPIAAGAEEYSATQDGAGEIAVLDEAGAPVLVVVGEPVGTRAEVCPSDAYYIAALPTDMSQLVLTDCATDSEHHSVEMQN